MAVQDPWKPWALQDHQAYLQSNDGHKDGQQPRNGPLTPASSVAGRRAAASRRLLDTWTTEPSLRASRGRAVGHSSSASQTRRLEEARLGGALSRGPGNDRGLRQGENQVHSRPCAAADGYTHTQHGIHVDPKHAGGGRHTYNRMGGEKRAQSGLRPEGRGVENPNPHPRQFFPSLASETGQALSLRACVGWITWGWVWEEERLVWGAQASASGSLRGTSRRASPEGLSLLRPAEQRRLPTPSSRRGLRGEEPAWVASSRPAFL